HRAEPVLVGGRGRGRLHRQALPHPGPRREAARGAGPHPRADGVGRPERSAADRGPMRLPCSLTFGVGDRVARRALVLLLLLVASPGAARAEFWKEKDWKDHDHKLTVCVKMLHCPGTFADSVKAAVDLWNAMHLTWELTWQGTDCDHPDIVIGCENLPSGELGHISTHYLPRTATVDHADIKVK